MKKKVYIATDHIISPLGFSTETNLDAIKNNCIGIKKHSNKNISDEEFYAAMLQDDILSEAFSKIENPLDYTKLEQMLLLAVHGILKDFPQLDYGKTALVVSTTKGNIDVLEPHSRFPKEKVKLYELGKTINRFFGLKNKPITLSNACISGGLAIAVGKRFLQSGRYENAIVVGGDLVSRFTFSGFNSLQAISEKPCKPFSKKRSGISLGEAAAAVLLTKSKSKICHPERSRRVKPHTSNLIPIAILGDSTANDANHISGPSRTGEGLFLAIQNALKEAKINPDEIDLISPHGTGTLFNDEMEAIAFHRAGLTGIPVNPLKGFYGHTLGASALLETIIAARSLQDNELYPTAGFDELGVSKNISITTEHKKQNLNTALKTASGFGGCNLAMVLSKKD